MDFVKREDQNVIDEENYKVYMDNVSSIMYEIKIISRDNASR